MDEKELDPEAYRVMRQKGTEPPFSGEYVDCKKEGVYHCKLCGQPLFGSDDKFDSGSGWPSYTQAIADGVVTLKTDTSHGMIRTEVLCSRCGSHLGHVFPDGPEPTGRRYCINSICLNLEEK
ncbi:MAG: peptide-methionine (R)-S-oxide reductase MsrB [Parachlamydiales bacterium]